MATMGDIAERLGVTKGTVSKALRGAPDVSETTRKAVVELAVELGYYRIPRAGVRKSVVIFIENMAYQNPDDFGWDLVTSFRKLAEPDGFQVDLIPLDVKLQRDTPYDEYMLGKDYAGAFFLGMTLADPWMRDFRTCRTPTVLFDNYIQSNSAVTHVGINNYEGMDLCVARLKELGHQKIGYLSSALGSYVYQERYKAFLQAVRQHGLDDDSHAYTGVSYYTSENLTRHLPRILKNGCTAVCCSNDLLAHSVMIHCAEMGLRIPEDLSIAGFDDIPLCRFTSPPLATVRQDRDSLGRSAYFALSSQMNGVPISTVQVHAQFIERGSIGPAPDEPVPLPRDDA